MLDQWNEIERKVLLLMLLVISQFNCVIAQQWEGYGNGINYARIQNDTIIYGVGKIHEKGTDYIMHQILPCNKLESGTNICKVYDDATLDYKYNLNVEVSQNFDTISIYHSKAGTKNVYIKDKLTNDQINLIKQIEIESFSESCKLKRRTIVDFSGIITIENLVKDSTIKIEISQDEKDAIRNSIKHLNYTQLNDIYGRRNFTGHESEIGFRFITEDNSKYYYIGVEPPEVFRPLLLVLRELCW